MNAVDSGGKRDVGAGVDEETSSETSSRFSVLSSQWNAIAHGGQGLPCQYFQFSRAQIFFAELDVVDSGSRCFSDLVEQGAAAGSFVAAKLALVGDVTEQTAVRHQLSAYYERFVWGANTPFGFAQGRALSAETVAPDNCNGSGQECLLHTGLLSRNQLQILGLPAHGG